MKSALFNKRCTFFCICTFPILGLQKDQETITPIDVWARWADKVEKFKSVKFHKKLITKGTIYTL